MQVVKAVIAAAGLAASLLGAAAIDAHAAADDAPVWTVSAGLGSTTAWNLVGITREFRIGEHTAVFVTAGLGEMILGAGIAWYADRDGDGVVASAVAGTGVQAALTYRVKLNSTDRVALGASYIRIFGFSDIDRPQVLPVVSWEHRF